MRLSIVLSLGLAAVLLTGCKTTYYYVDAGMPLGHACPTGDECYGGSFCFEGKCTIKCQSNADCAGFEGTECRPVGDAAVLTCVTVRYIKSDVATDGTPCAVDPNACAADPQCDPKSNCTQSCGSDDDCSPSYHCDPNLSTCMRSLFCYGAQQDDPDSYCTQECADDRDCPAKLYCETVPANSDRNRKLCVPRGFCTPCAFDSDCDLVGSTCATDDLGNKFCTTECTPPVVPADPIPCDPGKDINQDIDCLGVGPGDGRDFVCRASPQAGTWTCRDPNLYHCPQPFSECKDAGDGRNLCFHRAGTCKGDTSLCSPCRSDNDCDVASGAYCYLNTWSGERFCTSVCTGTGTCPDASYACYTWTANACVTNLDCHAPGATCDPNTLTCSPIQPKECLKSYDPSSASNAAYPTCWPDQAGYCCD